ncbi:MAG: phosphoribosylformylglycinamidine synthase subunit PurS [Bacillota bacterium]
MYLARVFVALKKGVLDPQGETIKRSLASMDFPGVEEVRVGKVIELKLDAVSEDHVRTQIEQMCKKLLANPVIEEYSFEIMEV